MNQPYSGSAKVDATFHPGVPPRHDPTWLHTGRFGRWCVCSCGWKSRNGTIMFAQLAFGRHLLAVRHG